MRARQVDGVITATARLDHELLDEMARGRRRRSCSSTAASRTAPAVGDRRRPRGRAPGGRAPGRARATRAIAHLGGPQELSRPATQRYEGFVAAMDAGRARGRPRARALRRARSPSPRARASARELLDARPRRHRDRRGQRPDGARLLRRASPSAACAARRTSRSSASTTCRSPTASTRRSRTIRIPHYEIGAAAAELLLERLQRAAGARATQVRARARARACAGRPRRPRRGLDDPRRA